MMGAEWFPLGTPVRGSSAPPGMNAKDAAAQFFNAQVTFVLPQPRTRNGKVGGSISGGGGYSAGASSSPGGDSGGGGDSGDHCRGGASGVGLDGEEEDSEGRYVMLADRWVADNLSSSTYVWLPMWAGSRWGVGLYSC
jgi:hypothetical protein